MPKRPCAQPRQTCCIKILFATAIACLWQAQPITLTTNDDRAMPLLTRYVVHECVFLFNFNIVRASTRSGRHGIGASFFNDRFVRTSHPPSCTKLASSSCSCAPKAQRGRVLSAFMTPLDAAAIINAAHSQDAAFALLLKFLLRSGVRIGEALSTPLEGRGAQGRHSSHRQDQEGRPATPCGCVRVCA
jgi:hypothetical protein